MYHTVWEIENYSTFQIPSEIIFGDFAIMNEKLKISFLGGSEVQFWKILKFSTLCVTLCTMYKDVVPIRSFQESGRSFVV